MDNNLGGFIRSQAGTASGTALQKFQVFDVVDPVGQTIFTCTTITCNEGTLVFVDGKLQDFGWTKVGQVITFDVAVGAGSRVTITGSTL